MIVGTLVMKPESHAFRGIAIGLLMSVPLWMAIAAMSWTFLGLGTGTEQSRIAQIEKSPAVLGHHINGQESADNSAQ